MEKCKIYTRSGDKGTTSLVGGHRVAKTDKRLEAYGTIDELNSHLGLLLTYLTEAKDAQNIERVQQMLFAIGCSLATENPEKTALPEGELSNLERQIDEANVLLAPQRTFLLPGGSRAAAVCHICRTVCRRAERRIRAVSEECKVDEGLMAYVNRLSDYLYILARKQNMLHKVEEKGVTSI